MRQGLRSPEGAIGLGVVALGLALGAGAIDISSSAGYSGVGANFLPWVVAALCLACGLLLLNEARTGGFRQRDEPAGAERADLAPFLFVSAGLLLNAALLTTLGFVLSCAMCFALAAFGVRRAQGERRGLVKTLPLDLAIGIGIAAPVYWMFGKGLDISLPGLTSTGWI